MTGKHVLTAVVAILLALACAPSASTTDPTSTARVLSVIGTPVPHSEVENAFQTPLSSGLSVADVTENALGSVVHVIAASDTGSGFIINETGLVVTNKHVVENIEEVAIRFANGNNHWGYVTQRDPNLDLAYIQILDKGLYTPMAIGNPDGIRVGENVIAIGFPLGRELGLQPTVSVGIVSAKRENQLQTDASINPGNSGGPLLDMHGNVVGVVVSRIEADNSGRPVMGIGFAIPITAVKSGLGTGVSPAGKLLPTSPPTTFPTIGPTPDLEATKMAIAAMDARRRQVEVATRTATEANQEAERYAASLEATRIAQLPTPTPKPTATPEPTPTPRPTATPRPTPTPHPATFCREWEAIVLEWIVDGNNYWVGEFYAGVSPSAPDHPQLTAEKAHEFCIVNDFPHGVLYSHGYINGDPLTVGQDGKQLLPGIYEYRDGGDNRVSSNASSCVLQLNRSDNDYWEEEDEVSLIYGEPFAFQFFSYHRKVYLYCNSHDGVGHLYRIGG